MRMQEAKITRLAKSVVSQSLGRQLSSNLAAGDLNRELQSVRCSCKTPLSARRASGSSVGARLEKIRCCSSSSSGGIQQISLASRTAPQPICHHYATRIFTDENLIADEHKQMAISGDRGRGRERERCLLVSYRQAVHCTLGPVSGALLFVL